MFAQGIGAALGVTEPMTSPTFTLVNTYDCGNLTVHHADLYRLDRTVEVADLALSELAEFSGVVLIEWGEAAIDEIVDYLEVHIDVDIDDDAVNSENLLLTRWGPVGTVVATCCHPLWRHGRDRSRY